MIRAEPESPPNDKNTALSRVSAVLEAILPPSLRHADIEERGRARILVGFTLILVGVAVAMVVLQALHGTKVGVVTGLLMGSIYVAILIGIRSGVSLRVMGHALTATIFAFSVGIMISSAAHAVGADLVVALLPLISLLVVGPRAALGWTAAALGGVAATAVYASSTDTYLLSGTVLSWEQARFPVLAAMLLFVHTATLILERARRLAIREVHSSKDLLETQDARYRSIVEALGDVLMDFDEKGNCQYVGPNVAEVLGRDESEFLGQRYLPLIHPDDAESLRELYRFCTAHPGAARALALRVRRKSGEWLTAQLSSRCFFDESGELHFTVIARDTTSLRLAEMTTRHHERLKAAGTLSAGIAHQINNPIGSILNASQFALISLEANDVENVERALRDNIEQAARCGKIVRSLLHFAARETPKIGRENLLDIVRRSRDFTLSYAGESSIEIEISGHLEPLWVDVNSIEIEQVLINLLRNAIESQPTSKRVQVVVSRLDSRTRIEVQDDGCGITENDRSQIFDPFYTTRIREGGSGLGLSVSHGIIRDHRGSMDVESLPDKGTRMGVELPLASD